MIRGQDNVSRECRVPNRVFRDDGGRGDGGKRLGGEGRQPCAA